MLPDIKDHVWRIHDVLLVFTGNVPELHFRLALRDLSDLGFIFPAPQGQI